MIGLFLATTSSALALMRMSRHLRVLRASSMSCGASTSGECWRPVHPYNLLGFLLDEFQPFRKGNRPRAFTFLRVHLVRFLASASATSRVIPNTANVLMASLQSGAALRDLWWRFGLGWGITGDRHGAGSRRELWRIDLPMLKSTLCGFAS